VKKPDQRSFLVALVPDRLVNPPPDPATAAASNRIVDLLVELGYGLVQLPPASLTPAKAAVAIAFALDQLEDYAANGYRTVWLAGGPGSADADLTARIEAECARRALGALRSLDLGALADADATALDARLREFAAPAQRTDPAATASELAVSAGLSASPGHISSNVP
jgi:hypothetical protein